MIAGDLLLVKMWTIQKVFYTSKVGTLTFRSNSSNRVLWRVWPESNFFFFLNRMTSQSFYFFDTYQLFIFFFRHFSHSRRWLKYFWKKSVTSINIVYNKSLIWFICCTKACIGYQWHVFMIFFQRKMSVDNFVLNFYLFVGVIRKG